MAWLANHPKNLILSKHAIYADSADSCGQLKKRRLSAATNDVTACHTDICVHHVGDADSADSCAPLTLKTDDAIRVLGELIVVGRVNRLAWAEYSIECSSRSSNGMNSVLRCLQPTMRNASHSSLRNRSTSSIVL